MTNSETMVSSPCVDVCQLDFYKQVCIGCYRTLDEIGRWREMTDDERKIVLDNIEDRKERWVD